MTGPPRSTATNSRATGTASIIVLFIPLPKVVYSFQDEAGRRQMQGFLAREIPDVRSRQPTGGSTLGLEAGFLEEESLSTRFGPGHDISSSPSAKV